MAFSRDITFTFGDGLETISKKKSYSASARADFDETIADSSTDSEVAIAIDVSAVKYFYLVSDQAVTIETNSGSAADNTIVLVADMPYVWTTQSYDAFLLDTDVTSVFITNASGASATIKLRCLQDATP